MPERIDFLTLGASSAEAEVDSGKALRNMRLKSQRALLEAHLTGIGARVIDDHVTDLFDIKLKRHFTRASSDGWSIALLEVPNWILSDGDRARDLDAIRHGFRRETVRFVCRDLDVPSPAVRRVFRDWKTREEIDARLIPWSDLGYLQSGDATLAEVLGVDLVPASGTDAEPAAPTQPAERDRIFISYSHANPEWFRRLEIHLAAFGERLDIWSDEKIPEGSDWFPEIQTALESAKVAVLLVTPEFVASDFIRRHEVPKILEAAERNELTLIWIHVSDSHYQRMGLDQKQASHNVSEPLDGMTKSKRNTALKEITGKIAKAFES